MKIWLGVSLVALALSAPACAAVRCEIERAQGYSEYIEWASAGKGPGHERALIEGLSRTCKIGDIVTLPATWTRPIDLICDWKQQIVVAAGYVHCAFAYDPKS